jgi:bacteriocin biosynthesis cyclodehydratase domain-containing protein
MTAKAMLRIKRQYSVVVHGPDVVELRCGVWNPISFTLRDESGAGYLYRLIRGLDGSVSSRDLSKREDVPRTEVEALIDHLDQLGVLESTSASAFDYYLDTLVPTLSGAMPQVQSRNVLLLGDEVVTQNIRTLLAASSAAPAIKSGDGGEWDLLHRGDTSWLTNGLEYQQRVAPFERWKDSLLVYAVTSIDPVRFQIVNRIAMAHGIPWIHAAIDGPFLFIGPTVVPRRTACYECFEARVVMNLREQSSYQRYKEALAQGRVLRRPSPIEPVVASVLASHIAMEVVNFLTTGNDFTMGKTLAIYLPTMEFSFSDVLRLPNCPACGSSPEKDDRELYFDMRALFSARQ